jgi:LVIVD repeat
MRISKGPMRLSFALSAVLIYALCDLGEKNSIGSANGAVAVGLAPQKSQGMSNWGISRDEEARRSAGCLDCHKGIEDIHNGAVILGCIDCHGGDATVRLAAGVAVASPQYEEAKNKSHLAARFPRSWKSSANPQRSNALLNRESLEFIRFVNPGDLRVSQISCGAADCHANDVHNVGKSMMTTGAMLWGAALYNNGAFPFKDYRFGESYGPDGIPQRLQTIPPPTPEAIRKKGILPYLDPLPRWEISQMGNILRTFERGGRKAAEVGLPIPQEPPGRPTQNLLSPRGLGTVLRTDPVYLGLQKTRLLDPMLSFLGTNDHPGDYRSSGCTACHIVYANDRDPFHSGPYAQFGHTGFSHSADSTIPKNEPGHPIKHQFTRAIPSSQCVVCHMHPGTLVVNTFYGFTWWDLETDGEHLYPKESRKLSDAEVQQIQERNPEGSALRGLWGDPKFLERVSDLNPKLKLTQFADFAGHGWIFRAVFKKDRKGNLLDVDGKTVPEITAERLQTSVKKTTEKNNSGMPVHLKDIHLEKGMHCVDCHFRQDNHGNGKLYGETRNAVEIDCVDCHGTIQKRADPTSRAALTSAAAGGNRMLDYRKTPFGNDRFFTREGKLYQRSAVEKDKAWEVVQVMDTVTPGGAHYNEKSRIAKTLLKDGKTWGGTPQNESELAHPNATMTCFACHTSWMPSCFGCHLKMQANQQRPMLHNEAEQELRNWTSYNFQTLRDDVFMLGRDGTVTGRRFAPMRSACAVLVSSQNANREWIYFQQQTVSAEGYSGTAFSSCFPHTVRGKETRGCTDCHVSANNDNNAIMAQTLMQGTNFYNFLGRYVYVAQGKEGFEAIIPTERDEPQAVIGSGLHKLAYPEEYRKHQERGGDLQESYHHPGNDVLSLPTHGNEVLNLQLRGEYLYTANGKGGFRAYDVANIDQKGFSERLITAPVSPLGQKFYVKTKYATAVASPSTMAVDPTRRLLPENEEATNRDDKQLIHPLYGYIYVTDKYEGLILIGAATLLDGNPRNNFLKRALTFNPGGILAGANNLTIAGVFAYITCDRGLVILNINDPLNPKVITEIGAPSIKSPRAVQVQFRYAFVCDSEGVKVLDVTTPEKARLVEGAVVPLSEARNIYLVRTYGYVAAGNQGMVVLDIERPDKPRIDQVYNADGKINDAHDVKVGMTNTSLYAYVADGHNGLRVVQLTSPETTPGNDGFSPRPSPQLIASYHTHGPALAVSEGLDRDRAVDESGNQLAVFGRRGSRPMNLLELQRMYMKNNEVFVVPEIKSDDDIRKSFGAAQRGSTDEEGAAVNTKDLFRFAPVVLPLAITLFLWRKAKRG